MCVIYFCVFMKRKTDSLFGPMLGQVLGCEVRHGMSDMTVDVGSCN